MPTLLDKFIKSRRIDFDPFPGANAMMQIARHREWHDRLEQTDQTARATAQVVTSLNMVLGSIVMCAATRQIQSRRVSDLLEVAMNDALIRLASGMEASTSPSLAAAMSAAMRLCLAVMMDFHERTSRAFPVGHLKAHTEPMTAEALIALSTRDAAAVAQFGVKHVEDVFEVQLALLFQSLGFLVVRTRRRWRSIDMICVSHDVPDPVTILVEAKTSAHPYGLPTDDERAIAEYVATLRGSLRGVPSLRAVLLVGGLPAKPLGQRLRRLESVVSLPVRYCSAGDLALLRERTTGLLSSAEFMKSVLTSADIVSSDQLAALAESAGSVLKAFREFVGISVGGRGVRDAAKKVNGHEAS